MFEWLSALPIWFQIIISSSIILMSIFFIMTLVKRGFGLRTKNFDLNINSELQNISPHKNCPHAKDILYFWDQAKEIEKKISIEKNEILRKQITYAKDILAKLNNDAYYYFLDFLHNEKQFLHPYLTNLAYNAKISLELTQIQLLEKLEMELFIPNNLQKLEGDDFEKYLKTKCGILILFCTSRLLELYFPDISTPMVEIKDLINSKYAAFEYIIRDILIQAREISIKNYNKIEELENTSKSLLTCLLGK